MAAGRRAGRGRGKRGEAAHHHEDESASRPAPHRAASAARPRACAVQCRSNHASPRAASSREQRVAGAQHLTHDGGWRTRRKSGLMEVGEAEVVAQARLRSGHGSPRLLRPPRRRSMHHGAAEQHCWRGA
ncbi:hypothetical protein PVAP13_4KG069980 [Panicum virgatum]|uniref:Uncharacterized protein n=1 Tax=Panicum virgatum TaxID=38727 RepID=A0A8T0TC14_PANVG|nr:hypothetical protein PVAP13_4KG069980 [Panicum virgatum]